MSTHIRHLVCTNVSTYIGYNIHWRSHRIYEDIYRNNSYLIRDDILEPFIDLERKLVISNSLLRKFY
jgi:hypothetical protein